MSPLHETASSITHGGMARLQRGKTMIEDSAVVRRKLTAKSHGIMATWWYYNRYTLLVLFLVILGDIWQLHYERELRVQAENNLRLVSRMREETSCYVHDRSTSLIIAGGSRKALNDALLDASAYASTIRLAWVLEQEAREKKIIAKKPQ